MHAGLNTLYMRCMAGFSVRMRVHAGASVTLFLFGEAHQAHYRESEGAVVALFDARLDARDGGAALKLFEERCILKLGTSADFALCGAKKKARAISIDKC